MKKKHEKYWNILEEVAKSQDKAFFNHRVRIASCIVYKNKIVGIGINQSKSNPFQKKFAVHEGQIYPHAEMSCIKNALRNITVDELERATMYVLRVKRDEKGKFVRAMAKPCDRGCQQALAVYSPKQVFYTTDDGYEELFSKEV